jgi:hypothetical protein
VARAREQLDAVLVEARDADDLEVATLVDDARRA